MIESFRERVSATPQRPGVYQFFNESGDIIYVGKAKHLRRRLSSYTRKQLDSDKTRRMIEQAVDFSFQLTASEADALLLEADLIKAHRPRYNILLRDDKSYPYLYVACDAVFPRMDCHRGYRRNKGQYFGPYPSLGSLRSHLALLQKIFQVRQCPDSVFRHRSRPCLQYQIKRCTAPCVGYVSQADYAQQVKGMMLFLRGDHEAVVVDLQEGMDRAAAEQRYEDAAIYRDRIRLLRQVQSSSTQAGSGHVDVLALAHQGDQWACATVHVRDGKIIGSRVLPFRERLGDSAAQVMHQVIVHHYGQQAGLGLGLDALVLAGPVADRLLLQKALTLRYQKEISLVVRPKGHAQFWCETAQHNADFHVHSLAQAPKQIQQRLVALQQLLDMPEALVRLECFDVSHIQGQHTVASCVVMTPDGLQPSEHRRFKLKHIRASDDYEAIEQAVIRRYQHHEKQGIPWPDVILIDGGLAQLQRAVAACDRYPSCTSICVGIAKGRGRKPGLEKVYRQGSINPLACSAGQPGLLVLQQLRDEAHRVAIGAQRRQLRKAATSSPLDEIAGVGPKRKQQLLRHFAGMQGLKRASCDEVASVRGISYELAQRIVDYLRGN